MADIWDKVKYNNDKKKMIAIVMKQWSKDERKRLKLLK